MDSDVTVEQFNAEIGAAKTAMIAGNYPTARQKLALATFTFNSLPQTISSSGKAATMRQQLDSLKQAIDDHERASQGAGSTQLGLVSFARAV